MSKYAMIMFTLFALSFEAQRVSAKEANISIKVETNAFKVKGTIAFICFVFTGFNNGSIIENARVEPCNPDLATENFFVGSRAWQNFSFVADRFGHTWISEMRLNRDFLSDTFQAISTGRIWLRPGTTSYRPEFDKVAFNVDGLGETHIRSYAKPFYVDLDWNGEITYRGSDFRLENQQARVQLTFEQEQRFIADDDGQPIQLKPVGRRGAW